MTRQEFIDRYCERSNIKHLQTADGFKTPNRPAQIAIQLREAEQRVNNSSPLKV